MRQIFNKLCNFKKKFSKVSRLMLITGIRHKKFKINFYKPQYYII